MKRGKAPRLEPRRAADFERALLGRARAWIPSWSLDESAPDFGQALLKIAARFNSEVAERLDGAGDKMALGFLDWLGLRAEAARPARMPVVLRLAETAREAAFASRPVKMQVNVKGATVTFETETNLTVVPGRLEAVVAVDPAKDYYFLPPPGIAGLDPLEPLPTAWQLKNFASEDSTTLQLDPGLGLAAETIVEIDGGQYRIVTAKDDLVTIEPPVPTGGFDKGMRATKVESFHPFDTGVCNRQEHILYVGDPDLLNVDAAARIEVGGLPILPAEVVWQYWGKDAAEADDADPGWRPLESGEEESSAGALILVKREGAVEPTQVGVADGRWIRARLPASEDLALTEGVSLRINPRKPGATLPDELTPLPQWDKLLRPDVFVNATPSPPSDFYPLGREPRLFDTLYLGSKEAFSKKDATVWVQFDLADAEFQTLAAIDAGQIGFVLAGIDRRGSLHLLRLDADGTVKRLAKRKPMKPEGGLDLVPEIPPTMWMDGDNLYVAAATATRVHVWKEVSSDAAAGAWLDYEAPPAQGTITGLVLVDWTGRTLVALVAQRLWRRSAAEGAQPWTDRPLEATANVPLDVNRIVQVRHETAGSHPTKLLAISDPSPHQLYYVEDALAPIDLGLSGVAADVAPVGTERSSGGFEAIAATATRDGLLASRADSADAVTSTPTSPPFDPGYELTAGASIGGRIEDGALTAYAIAGLLPSGSPCRLMVWQPFRTGFSNTLFWREVPSGLSDLRGSVLVAEPVGQQPYALLVGRGRGQIFAARLGGARTASSMPVAGLVSALAAAPADPVSQGHVAAILQAGSPVGAAVVTNGSPGFPGRSSRRFFWLDRWLDADASERDVFVFDPALIAPDQADITAANKVEFPAIGTTPIPDCIVIDDAGTLTLVALSNIDQVQKKADMTPPLSGPATGVSYWLPAVIRGEIHPAALLNAGETWSVDDLLEGHVYFPALNPKRQLVVAYETWLNSPRRLVFDTPWIPPLPLSPNVRFAVDGAISGWASLFGDTSSNPALSWEYWGGSGWEHLAIDDAHDTTNDLRNSGYVTFKVPEDMAATEWAGKTNYWIRARLIGGDYGKETVKVVTVGNEQTVVRTTEGVQPPYALNVGVSYALDDPVTPRFVITEDSGTLRDQSDANRTPGAKVEIFTPLAVALARLDEPASKSGEADACVPDCACPGGEASASPAPPSIAAPAESPPSAPRAGRRAIYAGFSKKPVGAQVNLLAVAAREGRYDNIAPLAVDALIGDHFRPVVATDETRGLGETGLIKMVIDGEPVQAELFGKTLFWLRLTPARGDAGWAPSLAGLYPNAVWARAAETMTRELLGSSEGQPLLTLGVARPPLLKNSLELRVREPLGEEEREALVKKNPKSIRRDIPNLPGDWVLWKQVPDPVDWGPTDRVYALDESTGAIHFGDGRHGMIPPVGADSIIAFAYQRTEPASAGGEIAANFVTARTELNLVTPVESVETVVAADRSAGGVAPETAPRVLEFASATLRHRGRAVSKRDFEEIVRQNSADVVQARCFARNGRLRLVVVMRGADPAPNEAQKRELARMLLEVAPPTLGASGALTIDGPKVRRLRIALELRVRTLDVAGAVATEAKNRLVARFDTEHGGEQGEAWPLGNSPREDDIAEVLVDVADLDGIESIRLDEVGAIGTEMPWPAALGPGDLAMLAPADIAVGFNVAEAIA